MKKLRKLFLLALATCSAVSLTACGGKNGEKKEIIVWNSGIQTTEETESGNKEDLPVYQEIKKFEEDNPDYKITIVNYGMDDLQKALTSANMAKEGPDIVALWAGSATLGYQDYMTDLNEYLNDEEKALYDTSSLTHKNNNSEEALIGIPYGMQATGVMYYNKKILAENGIEVPTTWKEFVEASKKLKAKGITPLEVGDKEGYTSTWVVCQMLGNLMGPDDIRKLSSGEEKISGENFTKALKIWKEYVDAGYTNVDYLTKSEGEGIQAFIQGEAAMLIHGNWSALEYNAMGDDVGVVRIPAIEGPAEYKDYMYSQPNINLVVPSYANNKEQAVDFIKRLAAPEFTQKSNEALYSKPTVKGLISTIDTFTQNGKNITGFDSLVSAEAANEFYKLVPTYINGTITLEDFTAKLDDLNK